MDTAYYAVVKIYANEVHYDWRIRQILALVLRFFNLIRTVKTEWHPKVEFRQLGFRPAANPASLRSAAGPSSLRLSLSISILSR